MTTACSVSRLVDSVHAAVTLLQLISQLETHRVVGVVTEVHNKIFNKCPLSHVCFV